MTITLQDLDWANIEFLEDCTSLDLATVGTPGIGMDRLAIVRFDWLTADLDDLLTKLGISKPLRAGYRSTTAPADDLPEWWTPYEREDFRGARGLFEGLGREVVVHVDGANSAVFLRTYET